MRLAIAACATTACRDAARPTAAVQVAVLQRVRGIAPGYSLDYSEGTAGGMVFEPITERDSLGIAVPWLAKRWASPDSQTWTFTLRSGVTFHDGTPLLARDVVRSWTALVADSTDANEPPSVFMQVRGAAEVRARTATAIAGLQALDDTTLRLELLHREPALPRTLGSRRLGVMGKASTRRAPVGTGPWRFVAWETGDSLLRFVRWERYWSERAASESLLVRLVPVASLGEAFAAGQIDCANDLSDAQAAELAGSRALRLIAFPTLSRTRILLNFRHPGLRDIRVRRALLMALDRVAIMRAAGMYNAVVSDGVVPPALLSDNAFPPTSYDPDSARLLLGAAGFSAARPLRLVTPFAPGTSTGKGLGHVIFDYWRAIGIRTEAIGSRGDDSPQLRPPSDVEVWTEEPGIATAEEYLNLIAIEGPYGFFAPTHRWDPPEFRLLYQRARAARNPLTRDTAVRAMSKLAYDSLPSLPLFFTGSVSARSLHVTDCREQTPRYGTSVVTR